MVHKAINNLCKKCFAFHNDTVVKDCSLCNKLAFQENILCQLTSNCQQNESFKCGAFRPSLSLITNDKNKNKKNLQTVKNQEDKSNINKIKWFTAYAKQQLKINPNQIYFKLKYHICLCTRERKKIFSPYLSNIESISEIFRNIENDFKNTEIHLLCLRADHAHLYIDSSPDYSIDELTLKTIEKSEKNILRIIPEIGNNNAYIWERNYYSGTVS